MVQGSGVFGGSWSDFSLSGGNGGGGNGGGASDGAASLGMYLCGQCAGPGRGGEDGFGGSGNGPLFWSPGGLDRGGTASNGKASFTIERAGQQITRDNVLWGGQMGQAATVTWAFRADAPATMPTDTSGFSVFNAAQQSAALLSFAAWSDVARITFVRQGGDGYSNNASILLGNYAEGSEGAAAFAYFPGSTAASSVAGDVWINSSLDYNASPVLWNYGLHTLTHEIGHAIGLNHPSSYNAGPGQTITYGANASYYEDSRQYSLMSYFGAGSTGANHGGVNAAAPQLDDIAAAQRLYGANMTTRTGDTTYGFNSTADRPWFSATAGGTVPVFAVWDAGGSDTFDFSGYGAEQLIDLRSGAFSNVGGLTGNVAVARGVVIENAIGGTGSDTIRGNDANNVLNGNGGSDAISGGGGDDVITVGRGSAEAPDVIKPASTRNTTRETAVSVAGSFDLSSNPNITDSATIPHATVQATSAGGFEYYRVTAGADGFVIADIDGASFDTILQLYDANGVLLTSNDDQPGDPGSGGLDSYIRWPATAGQTFYVVVASYMSGAPMIVPPGGTYTLHLSVSGAAVTAVERGSSLFGDGGNDVLNGGVSDDRLDGGSGDDQIRAGGGADFAAGQAGQDVMSGGDGNDALFGNSGGDTLLGEAGDDYLDGGEDGDFVLGGIGRDTLLGGTGDDLLGGEEGDDLLDGGAGRDTLYGATGADTVRGGDGDDVVYGGGANLQTAFDDGNDFILGGTGDDVLYGEAGDDRLGGEDGDDSLLGGFGADTLEGGAGADLLVGDYGDDLLSGQDGNDALFGGEGNDLFFAGSGSDVMTGGAGADRFMFFTGDSVLGSSDRVVDFEVGVDKIDLGLMDADTTVAGKQAFAWAGLTNAPTGAGTVRLGFIEGVGIFIFGYTDADDTADFILDVGTFAVTGGDLILG